MPAAEVPLNELLSKKEIICINIPTKAEERSITQISFRTKDPNIRQAQSGICIKNYSWSMIHCVFKIRQSAQFTAKIHNPCHFYGQICRSENLPTPTVVSYFFRSYFFFQVLHLLKLRLLIEYDWLIEYTSFQYNYFWNYSSFIHFILYNNQIDAHAPIGQSAMGYCVVPENIHTFPTEGIFFQHSPSLWEFQ